MRARDIIVAVSAGVGIGVAVVGTAVYLNVADAFNDAAAEPGDYMASCDRKDGNGNVLWKVACEQDGGRKPRLSWGDQTP